jgi:hypothetical protein
MRLFYIETIKNALVPLLQNIISSIIPLQELRDKQRVLALQAYATFQDHSQIRFRRKSSLAKRNIDIESPLPA